MAAVRWDFDSWLPVPELGLDHTCRCAFITVSFNARSIYPDVPGSDHTPFTCSFDTQVEPERSELEERSRPEIGKAVGPQVGPDEE